MNDMKTRIISIGKVENKKKFPKLMKCKDSNKLVYFMKPGVGQILCTDLAHGYDTTLGDISHCWGMDYFEDMPETHIAFNVEEEE